MDSPAPFLPSSFLPLLFFSLPLPYAFSPFLLDVFFLPVLSAFARALVAFELPVLFFVATKREKKPQSYTFVVIKERGGVLFYSEETDLPGLASSATEWQNILCKCSTRKLTHTKHTTIPKISLTYSFWFLHAHSQSHVPYSWQPRWKLIAALQERTTLKSQSLNNRWTQILIRVTISWLQHVI